MIVFDPQIPREMLWTDLKSMDEFLELDSVNFYFFDYYTSLCGKAFDVNMDAVQVFNEVYYQATSVIYEGPYAFYLPTHFNEIRKNLGRDKIEELVMSMVYWLIGATDQGERIIDYFCKQIIKQVCVNTVYWLPFRKCCMEIRERGYHLKYNFKPNPVSPEKLREHIRWPDITSNYNLEYLKTILNFWTSADDRRVVAARIKDSLEDDRFSHDNVVIKEDVIKFLDSYIDSRIQPGYMMPSLYVDNPELQELFKKLFPNGMIPIMVVKDLHVGHADVAVGVAEEGSNVYHH